VGWMSETYAHQSTRALLSYGHRRDLGRCNCPVQRNHGVVVPFVKEDKTMPLILWLLGVPLTLVLVLMLLGVI
jgi:hypothetical protein